MAGLSVLKGMLLGFYETYPLIAYAVATLAVLAASELGRLTARWQRWDSPTPELTTLEGAGLGLLALMIGFTFAMTLTRFDARLKGVVDEANAIGTTALRARMLPEPHAEETRKLLDTYVQLRLEIVRAARSQGPSLNQAIRLSNGLQTELWRHAVAVSTEDPHSIPAGLFTSSLNEMIDLQEVRLAAARNRVPYPVFVMLYGVAMVTVGFSSYVAGLSGKGGRIPHAVMAILIGIIIAMVEDIDRSQSGFITVSQQSLINLEGSVGP
jgi:hypothetical protein